MTASGVERTSTSVINLPAPVEMFRSASQNNDPNLYPGERPAGSYLTDGHVVQSIRTDVQGNQLEFFVERNSEDIDLSDYLRQQGVPGLEDRYPVLAFGANMAPGSLANKFRKDVTTHDDGTETDNRPDLSIVPTVYAELAGHDVVWSGAPGVNGNFAAALYAGPETAGTTVQVGINFLTREQLLMMHATELSYNLSTLNVNVAGQTIQTYFYAGSDSVALSNGSPIAVQGIPAEGRQLEATTTEKLLNDLLADTSIMTGVCAEYPDLTGVKNTRDYFDFIKTLKSSNGSQPKRDLKLFIEKLTGERRQSRVIMSPNVSTGLVSWANPSTLKTYGQQIRGTLHPNYYVLPTQELPKDAWTEGKARDKVLRAISAHLIRSSEGQLKAKQTKKDTKQS